MMFLAWIKNTSVVNCWHQCQSDLPRSQVGCLKTGDCMQRKCAFARKDPLFLSLSLISHSDGVVSEVQFPPLQRQTIFSLGNHRDFINYCCSWDTIQVHGLGCDCECYRLHSVTQTYHQNQVTASVNVAFKRIARIKMAVARTWAVPCVIDFTA